MSTLIGIEGTGMDANERRLIRELNSWNGEVIDLYYAGYHDEAIAESNKLMLFAKEKLGENHPILLVLLDNFEFIKVKPLEAYKVRKIGPDIPLVKRRQNMNEIKRRLIFPDEVQEFGYKNPVDLTTIENKATASSVSEIAKWVTLLGLVFCVIIGAEVGYLMHLNSAQPSDQIVEVPKKKPVRSQVAIKNEEQSYPDQAIIDVDLIMQYPELPRGCEVTSLAMLLDYAGVPVNKMTLAKEVKKDRTPYARNDGQIHYGNPYDGFVGDMYNLGNPGLGVYYGPIMTLMEQYMKDKVVNLTGKPFDSFYYYLGKERPIWVITNVRFKKLPDTAFRMWKTPSGPLQITNLQHSVLVTGYDDSFIYFNDPMYPSKNRRVLKKDFEAAWKQMGSQALTYESK